MKIVICVPCTGTVEAAFARSLADMVASTMMPNINYNGAITKPHIKTLIAEHGGVEFKRTNLALAALQSGADYILWCDSDHTFPADALLRLLQHDIPIVGSNYARRCGTLPSSLGVDGKPLYTTASKAKAGLIEEAGAVGLGFCLMKAPIFQSVPHPWFTSEIDAAGRLVVGEDVHFCNQARTAGFTVHVDHGLSWQIGHVGRQILLNSNLGEGVDACTVLSQAGDQ